LWKAGIFIPSHVAEDHQTKKRKAIVDKRCAFIERIGT
jgi:hypothetical protein